MVITQSYLIQKKEIQKTNLNSLINEIETNSIKNLTTILKNFYEEDYQKLNY